MDGLLNFIQLYFNITPLVDHDRVRLGGGINLHGISIDDGQTWYLYYEGTVVAEEDFFSGAHVLNTGYGCTAVELR